jgi:malic enzyme
VRGEEYESLVDEFVDAVKSEFPHALIQWEDFRKDNALRIMDRYRDSVLSFNDDIQGTGAVALAGILSASRIHGCRIRDERVLVLGAGAAGLGITRQLRVAMQKDGLEGEDLRHAIAVLDSKGLIIDDGSVTEPYKLEMSWSKQFAASLGLGGSDHSLEKVCEAFKPTVLIGASGQPGAFSEAVIRNLADRVERPVILPLSNPTDQSEVFPVDAITWSRGRALVAAGSPFADVSYDGKIYRIGQGNNAFIFPGIGLGAILAKARKVTDSMFYAAAKALADEVTDDELASGLLFPTIDRLKVVSTSVARAVIQDAIDNGLAEPLTKIQLEKRLTDGVWRPAYPEYEFSPVS